MSAASEAIADLDAELAETGQNVTLRRLVANGADITRPFRAFVRGYRPDELVGGIDQGDTLVVMSPTGLPTEFADADATRLRQNDLIEIDGKERNVEYVDPVRINGTLVRINALVRG